MKFFKKSKGVPHLDPQNVIAISNLQIIIEDIAANRNSKENLIDIEHQLDKLNAQIEANEDRKGLRSNNIVSTCYHVKSTLQEFKIAILENIIQDLISFDKEVTDICSFKM